MLTISPQGLYLSAPPQAPQGTKAQPVVGLVIDENNFGVVAALILDESGRVSRVSAQGLAERKFRRQE
jgi:hypothetical protein